MTFTMQNLERLSLEEMQEFIRPQRCRMFGHVDVHYASTMMG